MRDIDSIAVGIRVIRQLVALGCTFAMALIPLQVPAATSPVSGPAAPKLILQITIDQLRGDLPERYLRNMGQGGFRYLLEQGVWYAHARHAHANTESIVGHATLATGADPSMHGMVGNVWFDRVTGRLTYAIEDDRYPILTVGTGGDQAAEMDSAQTVVSSAGRSPARILGSTFSDELALFTAGQSKIFGVSGKDRGAVPMAGHAGKAFWFSKASGNFISSTYYYPEYPSWVTAWSAKNLASHYGNQSWELMYPKPDYLFGADDDQPWGLDVFDFGKTFPHAYGPADGKDFVTRLTLSPAVDELTLDFAKTLLEAEQLGQDPVTDYLSISFSSTDYVGHVFGPSGLEMEDNLLRLDRMLADLFAFVDQRVGLENTLIVFSADHGSSEVPGYLRSMGQDAGYLVPQLWESEDEVVELKKRFGVGSKLIKSYIQPYIYLDRELIRQHKLDQEEVERAVAVELMKLDGVELAISSTALRQGEVADTPLSKAVLRNFNAERSGDIYLVHKPNFFISDGLTVSSSHGSPWNYDTFVPIVFAGGQLKAARIRRAVETVDVAPTLSALMGAKPPTGSRGVPLLEVFGPR